MSVFSSLEILHTSSLLTLLYCALGLEKTRPPDPGGKRSRRSAAFSEAAFGQPFPTSNSDAGECWPLSAWSPAAVLSPPDNAALVDCCYAAADRGGDVEAEAKSGAELDLQILLLDCPLPQHLQICLQSHTYTNMAAPRLQCC